MIVEIVRTSISNSSRVNPKGVLVLGASGSGKSSLVAAGVLPKLRERGWRILRCVPGDDPFYSVAQAMVSQLPEMGVKPTEYLSEARKLANILSQKPENLAQQLALTLPKQRVLLFLDQFEEVFTLASNNPRLKNEQKDEVSLFTQAVGYPASELTTLITLRADFYAAALPHFEILKCRRALSCRSGPRQSRRLLVARRGWRRGWNCFARATPQRSCRSYRSVRNRLR